MATAQVATSSTTTATSNQRLELCRYYLNGACRYGANCFNSHDRSLGARPSNVCRYYLQGACSYGAHCRYDHVRPTPAAPAPTTTTPVNKNKQQLSLALNESSSNTKPPSSFYEALTGSKTATPTNTGDVNMFDEASMQHYLHLKKEKLEQAVASSAEPEQLCPYHENNVECPFGEQACAHVHGVKCEICSLNCLHPYDKKQQEAHRATCMREIESEMEEAFAVQRSADKVCGICMETVWEKEKKEEADKEEKEASTSKTEKASDCRFGILENCDHVFCLGCIRKWRSSKSYENKVVKACPECRVKSDFVTPSRFWFENKEAKQQIIADYKIRLSQTACKYFKQGDGHCPFGSKCFYMHRNKDGSLAELPEPKRRHRLNRRGSLEHFSNIIQIDFYSDTDDDDESSTYEDILEFVRSNLFWDVDDDDEDDENVAELFEYYDEFF